jgi:Protein of unknown function (DUF1553)/Protein of unknown function (DUF1549)
MKFAALVLLLCVMSHAQTATPDINALKKAALKIDQSVALFYRAKNLVVPQVTDDATFLRRSFLVTTGRIPTAEEAKDFLGITDATKREQLISYLISSKGYSSHMTNWAFDLLRIVDVRLNSTATNEPYRNWVRTAIENNISWKNFVTSLLSSSGDGWDVKSAGVGYYTRDKGMPLDNLAMTMRVFLGSRMECAQCHDDPYGTTERKDFYHLAAFTSGQKGLREDNITEIYDEAVAKSLVDTRFNLARLFLFNIYELSLGGEGEGRINLPIDYQYKDAAPNEMIGGKTPFGKVIRLSNDKNGQYGRRQFADWITTSTGEQFTSIIVNRMWKHIMGKGFYEPIDEYVPSAKTQNPELMNHLTQTMVDLNYDLRAFQQVLLLTKTFQFATNPNPSTVETGDDFHGRKIERLSAEQIWDSLITLASGDPDKAPRRQLDDRIRLENGDIILAGTKTMTQLSKEVLALRSEADVRSYFENLLTEISGNSSALQKADPNKMMNSISYNKDSQVRASELPSPAPRDHLLYLFGQSERSVVNGASHDPNVGQVLSLMNGFVQRQLVNNPNAHLYKSLVGAKTDEEKIRRIYIAILNRPPNTTEMEWMKEELKSSEKQGLQNIVSALVMSSEFLFLQ